MNTIDSIDLTADIINVRDIIARYEALEDERDTADDLLAWDADNGDEFSILSRTLNDIVGNGGDEQWRGDWYPSHLIADVYFTEYARELLEDCGTIPADLPSWVEIDWDATAKNVQVDYTPTDVDGLTYWYR